MEELFHWLLWQNAMARLVLLQPGIAGMNGLLLLFSTGPQVLLRLVTLPRIGNIIRCLIKLLQIQTAHLSREQIPTIYLQVLQIIPDIQ